MATEQVQQDNDPASAATIRSYEEQLRQQKQQHPLVANQQQNLGVFCKGIGVAVLTLGVGEPMIDIQSNNTDSWLLLFPALHGDDACCRFCGWCMTSL